MGDQILLALFSFGRSCIGIVTRPYETYRRIVNHGSLYELLPIAALLSSYFAIASVVKTAAFRPYLLTKHFMLLAGAVAVTYAIVVCLLWCAARCVGGRGTERQLALGWAYTLVPTVTWFFVTSILYVLIPPPRTGRPLGIIFSVLYLTFSSVLFFWKVMLSYLTLRFSMRLDLLRIAVVFFIVIPIMVLYSIGMYRIGIFRIPFL